MPLVKLSALCAAMIVLLAACMQEPGDVGLGPACASGLDAGNRDLERAKVDGLSGSVKWSEAASLLAAAKIQQQFNEYQNCVAKVGKARQYLSEIRG
jgi:hypothetical protein